MTTVNEQEMFDNVKETKERVTRMESRLVQLGDHVGANLRTKQRIDVKYPPMDPLNPFVEIDSLDVSISRIVTELQQARISGHVDVQCQGRFVATLHLA